MPKRGKTNEPSYIIHTALFLSELLKIKYTDLIDKINFNFYNIFTKAIKYERIIYEG